MYRHLRDRGATCISNSMKRIFDMDDRARLPWRFYGELVDLRASGEFTDLRASGATKTVLARL